MRTSWLKMQNSLLPREDVQSSSPLTSSYPDWKIRRNIKKKIIKVWILKRLHKQTSCCRSPTQSWLTKIATCLWALMTVPYKIDFYDNDFSTRDLQLWKALKLQMTTKLSLSESRQRRESSSLTASPLWEWHPNPATRPASGRSLSFHQHKGGRASMKSTLSTVHST